MKYLFALMTLALLASCQSRDAQDFNKLVDSTDKKVFRILVSDTTEKLRLNALIDKNPDVAISLAKKQVDDLSSLINRFDKINVENIKDATPFKTTTISSYKGLLQLKEADIREAELLALSLNSDSTKAQRSETGIIDLIRKRLEIHRVIGESDSIRYNAKLKFEKTNKLRK